MWLRLSPKRDQSQGAKQPTILKTSQKDVHFRNALSVNRSDSEATYVQSTLQGVSPVWAPPEMFDQKEGLTEKADVYSFARPPSRVFFEGGDLAREECGTSHRDMLDSSLQAWTLPSWPWTRDRSGSGPGI